MQRHIQDIINSQRLLNTALEWANNLMNDIANARNNLLQAR
jgi:hypothetical protein